MNYYDILLAKKLEDDRDLKVEGLSVTANGTYSEEGKVYKPVIVKVAGYGLADMPGGAIASFSDGAALPLNKLKVSIDPVQSGSGVPSPTNIRPITGWTECEVTVADDTTTPTVEQTYTIPFTDAQGQSVTVYGGSVDIVKGTIGNEKTLESVDLGTLNWTYSQASGNRSLFTTYDLQGLYKSTGSNNIPINAICESYENVSMETTFVSGQCGFDGLNSARLVICDNSYTDETEFKSAVSGIKLVYELATPSTVYTQPTSIKSIEGVNNVYADTGNILEGQYFKSL